MRDSDDLITCRRCEDQDADVHDGICLSCQGELLDMHEHQISWRTAWELEKQEKLAWKIGQNPDYVSQQLAELDKVFQSFKDDPDFIFAVATDRQTFLTRVEAVYQKHPNLRPQEQTNDPQSPKP
jgi:ribosomal protein L37E